MVSKTSCADESISSLEEASAPVKAPVSRGLRLKTTFHGLLRRRSSIQGNTDSESDSSHRPRLEPLNDDSSSVSSATESSIVSEVSRKIRQQPLLLRPLVAAPVTRNRRVSFAKKLSSIVATVPQLSVDDVSTMFYTKKELSKICSKAQRMAEDVAWNKDKHVLACIHHCYGFATLEDLTREKALQYYFNYEVQEKASKSEGGDGTRTTLRGLERQITSRIVEHRMNVVQSVLALQAKLWASGEPSISRIEKDLAKYSSHQSHNSRKFARLLGEGDAAICETKTTYQSM